LAAVEINPNKLDAQRDLISYYIAAPESPVAAMTKPRRRSRSWTLFIPCKRVLREWNYTKTARSGFEAANEAKAVLVAKPRLLKPYLEVAEYFQNREDSTEIRNAVAAIPGMLPPILTLIIIAPSQM